MRPRGAVERIEGIAAERRARRTAARRGRGGARLPLRGAGAARRLPGRGVFFVLSGFLITSLLLVSARTGSGSTCSSSGPGGAAAVPALLVDGVVLVWGARRRPFRLARPVARRHRVDAVLLRELALHLDEHLLRERRRREPARAHVVARRSRSSSTSLAARARGRRARSSGRAAGRRVGSSPDRLRASRRGLGSLWAAAADRAYLGTDSRIFEPLAGAVLAVLITSPQVRGRLPACTGP